MCRIELRLDDARAEAGQALPVLDSLDFSLDCGNGGLLGGDFVVLGSDLRTVDEQLIDDIRIVV